ncbi:MAG: 3-deoxy-8-phosphooctulonate synthase, partial [Deltaproteobacteria bacterium]|nr:3-deoxy-8-phosphooctulonate synthase [Deltaproteobacteria bacterium]
KKGQFLAPWDMKNAVEKVTGAGNPNVILTERGASFGYNTLVVDMTGLPEMAKFGAPIVIDATHAVQKPGGAGDKSGGNREMAPYIARAAVAAGVAAVFMEAHDDPERATREGRSDGPNMLYLNTVPALLDDLVAIDAIVKRKKN